MMVAVARQVPQSFRGLGGDEAVSSDLVPALQRLDAVNARAVALYNRPFVGRAAKARIEQVQGNAIAAEGVISQPPASGARVPSVAEANAIIMPLERELDAIERQANVTAALTAVGITAGFGVVGVLIWKYTKRGPR
jgi:hypothetical protein